MDELRKNLILEIIQFNTGWELASEELRNRFSFDGINTVLISNEVFCRTLKTLINKSSDEIEKWANFLECREDIDYESVECEDMIYVLANPLLSGFSYSQKELNQLRKQVCNDFL